MTVIHALVVAALIITTAEPATAEAAAGRRILIVTDAVDDAQLMRGFARQLESLFGHFAVERTDTKSVTDYAAGDVDQYDATFFFSDGSVPAPLTFAADVCRTRRTVVWLGLGLERLGDACDIGVRLGFTAAGQTVASVIHYKDVALDKGDPPMAVARILDPARADVLAWADAGNERLPYIVSAPRFWFVADNPLSGADVSDRYLAFADVLHDMLGEDHAPSRSALIRIEDVNALSDPARLRSIADRLYQADVPFVVGVVPFYVDPAQRVSMRLGDEPDVVAALQYMTTRGGTIALHGATHQYRGVTTTDFEFWDAENDAPIPGETPTAIAAKIERALAEMFRDRLYPVLWETPHYAASQLTYDVVARYFSTAMEQRLTVDDSRTSFFYPYLIRRDVHGQQIVPENLGYMPLEAPRVEHLLRAARANRVVRDGFASAFFHPFVRLAALDELVQGIKQLGYTFTDVRRFAQVVRAGDKAVITARGDVTLTLADRYLREYRFNEFGNLVDETGTSTRVTGELTRHVRLPHEWLYVAEASATPPPPYWIRQGRHAVQTIVQPFTLTRQFREARRAGAHIGPVQWLALGVSLGVVSLAAVGTIALTALRVHRAVVRRRERAHA